MSATWNSKAGEGLPGYVQIFTARVHQPDGAMCLACKRAAEHPLIYCDHLDFESMRVMKKDGDAIIVVCSSFERKS